MNKSSSKFALYLFTLFCLLVSLLGSAVLVTPVRAMTWTNFTTTQGLGSNTVNAIAQDTSSIDLMTYVATNGGLSLYYIATNGNVTFISNETTANGLGSNVVYDVAVNGMNVYAATDGGLSISTDGGFIFTNRTTADGLGSNWVRSVFVNGLNVYAATNSGLSISTNGGTTFTNKTTANGLGNDNIFGVFVGGGSIYAATASGMSISTDGGTSFTNKTMANSGLAHNAVFDVYVSGSTIYAATYSGLSISTDGATSFTNKLVGNEIRGVYVLNSTVYAATILSGLSISTDGGVTFTNQTTSNGLGSNAVEDVFAFSAKVYAATSGGFSYATANTNDITAFDFASPVATGAISGTNIAVTVPYGTNVTALVPTIIHNGASVNPNSGVAQDFTNPVNYTVTAADSSIKTYTVTITVAVTTGAWANKTTANGLGSNEVNGVFVSGSNIYAATWGGLSISTDGGATFTTNPVENLNGVFVSGSTIYIATQSRLGISTDGGATFNSAGGFMGLAGPVNGVYASGAAVYAATANGLSISTDGGANFTNKTTANGLGNNTVRGVYASGSTVYAATDGGLSISTDGGATFINKNTTNGLGSNWVWSVYANGSTVYVATGGGLSISTDGGATFINKTTANGLGSNNVRGVFINNSTMYVATAGGVSISNNGGATFTNYTSTSGLGSNNVQSVFASGSTVYAATTIDEGGSGNGGLSLSLPSSTEVVSDGESQTFGLTGVTITDVVGGNAPGVVTVTRYNTAPAGVPAVPAGQLSFWVDINAAVDSGLNVSLTLCYSLADIPAGINEANLVLYRYASGAWTAMGFDSHDLVNHCVTKNSISAFSVWTLGDGGSGGGSGGGGPIFVDVPDTYWAYQYIQRLYNAGITGGCGTTTSLNYCPEASVTRAQMSIFILRGMYGKTYAPPVATGTVFSDVSTSTFGAAWIEQFARDGITTGCGGGNYCPDQIVSRAQMAIFLLRGEHGSTYTPPVVGTSTGFADVPVGSFADAWIKQLALEAITSGCGGGNYCPNNSVTRAEMAVFLVRAFNLP